MTLHAKGYLAPPPLLLSVLLLLLLPALVVSRNPRQLSRPFNEASNAATRTTSTTARAMLPSFVLLPPTSWSERQAAGGLQIGSRALIARPEKRSVTSAARSISARQMVMVVRRVRAGAEGYLALARARLHQQTTNSAAAKRDLQYNKQRVARESGPGEPAAKAISGYFIPEMYHGQAELKDLLAEKRVEGQFLPGAINGLELHDRGSSFLPPRIIYVGQALPEPFTEPQGQRRGQVFGLSNFLIKGRPPMEPRSFEDEGELSTMTTERSNAAAVAQATPSIDQPSETTDLPPTATPSPRRVSSATRHRASDSIEEEDSLAPEENGDSTTVPSFEDDFAEDDELDAVTTTVATAKVAEYRDHGAEDYDIPDWDVSESQKREVQHDSRLEESLATSRSKEGDENNVEENGGGVYEFGYRVIDHATGSDFGHAESRSLGRATEGRYHVLLPDGRLQRVEYRVGSDTGFRAKVYFETAEDGTVGDTRAQAAPITDSAKDAPVAPMKVTNDAPLAAAASSAEGMIMAGAAKADAMDGTPAAMTGLTKVRSPARTRKDTEAGAVGASTLLALLMARQTSPLEWDAQQ